MNIHHLRKTIEFAQFYAMPKMHKEPWATRPVVSGICSVMESLSKWLDIQLQQIVHLCPCYLKDSWHFLIDIKKLGRTMKVTCLRVDTCFLSQIKMPLGWLMKFGVRFRLFVPVFAQSIFLMNDHNVFADVYNRFHFYIHHYF